MPLPSNFWEQEDTRLLAILEAHLPDAIRQGIELVQAGGIQFNNQLANLQAGQWAAEYIDALLQQLQTTNQKVVGETVEAWIMRPSSTFGELQAAIKDALQINETRAATIAVTEMTRAYANGNKIAYQAAGFSEMRWRTNNDELVCPICGPLNGKTTLIGQPFPGESFTEPPAHPNCRCWITPVARRIGSN